MRLDSVKMIGASAFQNCGSLKKVWLPSTLTSIGEKAFDGCKSITHVDSRSLTPTLGTGVFSLAEGNTSVLFVPNGGTANYNSLNFSNIIEGEYVGDKSDNDMTYSCYLVKDAKGDTISHEAILTTADRGIKSASVRDSISLGEFVKDGSDELVYYYVTSIGKYAFKNCKDIAKLELPAHLTSIGYNAFADCAGIKEIVSDVALKEMFSVADVFSGDINETALVYVPVGSKASYKAADGWSDFKNYDEGKLLQTVTPKDYLKYSYHTGLKTATVIEIVTPDDVTELSIPGTVEIDNTSYVVDKIAPSVVFSNKAKITSLIVGKGVKDIGANAFKGSSNLASVSLPTTLTTIGDYAFNGTKLTELHIDSVKSIGAGAFGGTLITELHLDSVKTIGASAFQNCGSLKKVWLPSTLTSIGEKAFDSCKSITHVDSRSLSPTLGAGLFSLAEGNTSVLFVPNGGTANYNSLNFSNIIEGEYVGDKSDNDMTYSCYLVKDAKGDTISHEAILTTADRGIKSASVRDSISLGELVKDGSDELVYYYVTSIGKYAFKNCTGLAKLELPAHLASIGYNAFADCAGIKEIVSDVALKDMFSVADVFSGDINETALVYVPVGSKASYQAADGWSDFKNYDEGKLLQTVTPKDYLKYSYHTGLKTATVIEIVTPDDLTDLSIPGTVEIDNTSYVVDKIAPSVVFSNKAKITSLTVGEGVKEIGANAFKGSSNLASVSLPTTLTTIGDYAFNGTKLTELHIDSVKSIGAGAFQGCTDLQKIWLPASLKSIGSKAFDGCKLTRVTTETTIEITKDVFSQYGAFLFVPTGTSVRGVTGWGEFARIYEGYYMGETTPNNDKTYIYLKQKNNDRTAILTASNTTDPIPNEITFDNAKYKVTIIGEAAFSGKSLNQEDWKELPESIVKIEKNAFKNCGLKELKLPSKLTTIGNAAFSGNTNLEELVLPSGIEEIGEKAFQNCKAFKQMELPASLKTIGDNIFDGCSNLTAVISKVKNDVVSSSTQSVAQAILYVPEGDRSYYGGWAFSHIVEGDRKLGNANGLYYAYSTGDNKAILIDVDTELTGGDIDIPSTITLDGIECEVVAIERDVFEGKTDIKSVIIGENVTTIGDNAFKGCSNLRKLEIPSTLKSIGENAFASCNNIAEVVSHNKDNDFIQNNALSLPNATFYVPENTQNLYEQAGWEFAQLFAGERVELEWKGLHFACMIGTQEAILVDATDTNTLAEMWADGEIVIPDSIPMGDDKDLKYYQVVAIASKAFSGNTDVKMVELPATLTSIDPTAFEGCTNLAEVVSKIDSTDVINSIALSLPDAILYVPNRAKYVDTEWKFAQIFVGDRVKEEQEGMQYICATGDKTAVLVKGLVDQLGTDITIPGTITIKIGEGENAKDLECKVTTIAANAFQGCTNLNKIWLPATLENIGEKAFDGCKDISYICSIGGTPLAINKNVFSTYTATLYVPVGSLSSYEQNDVWKIFPIRREGYFKDVKTVNGLTYECLINGEGETAETVAILTKSETTDKIVEIQPSVKLDGDAATSYNVTAISKEAFSGNNSKSNLEKLILPATLKKIEDEAFKNCTKLSIITSRIAKDKLFTFNENVFSQTVYDNAIVYVPYDEDGSTMAEYIQTAGWNLFSSSNYAQGEKNTYIDDASGMTYDYITGVGTATLTNAATDTDKVVVDGEVKIGSDTYIVTAIGPNAFKNCKNLKKIWLPASLTEIGKQAFTECKSLIRVSTESLPKIADDVFPESIPYLFIPDGKSVNGMTGWNSFTKVVEGHYVGDVTSDNISYICVESGAAEKTAMLVKAPKTASVFASSIDFEKDTYALTTIGEAAFEGNTAFVNLVIPEGVKTIEAKAFNNCSKLHSVELPSTLEKIGDNAFHGCSIAYLQNYVEDPYEIADSVFTDVVYNNATLYIPEKATDKYASAGGWKNFKTVVEGIASEVTIENMTYICVTNGDELTAKLTKGGSKNKELKIPAKIFIGGMNYQVVEIGKAALKGNTSLENLILPATLKAIGDYAFDGCSRLASVTCAVDDPIDINDNVFSVSTLEVNVSSRAAAKAYKEHKVWGKFNIYTSMSSVSGSNNNQETAATYQVVTPDTDDVEAPSVAIVDDDNVTGDFTIPSAVKRNGTEYPVTVIAPNTFENNTELTSVVIPSSITSIGDAAFKNCSNLTSITVNSEEPILLPGSSDIRRARTRGITSGTSVFEGVDKATCILYVPEGSVEKYKAAAGWGEFAKIRPMKTVGIEHVLNSEGAPFDVYNLQGRKVKVGVTTLKGLPSGVYIVNGKKVMVR